MKEQKTILFTGDSITDGNRYKEKKQRWDLNHQMGHTYAYVVNAMMGSMYPEENFHFVNRGVSGNRIIDLYCRSEVDLYPENPDILSILVGVNDGPIDRNNFEPTPQDKYEKVYRMFLSEIKERLPETKIVMMEPFVCKAGKLVDEYPIWRECVSGYAKTVKKLANEFGATFIPLQEKFDELCNNGINPPEYWSWDGVHPTENGHGIIAREWMKNVLGKELVVK